MDGVSFKADLLEGIHLCLGFHLGVDDGGRV